MILSVWFGRSLGREQRATYMNRRALFDIHAREGQGVLGRGKGFPSKVEVSWEWVGKRGMSKQWQGCRFKRSYCVREAQYCGRATSCTYATTCSSAGYEQSCATTTESISFTFLYWFTLVENASTGRSR